MNEQGEIRALTGIRGVAAFGVALTHINQTKNIFGVVAFGDQAVDLFFCLSAFTLCLVYAAGSDRRLNLREFFVARFARVYPLYALVLIVGGAISFALNKNGFPYSTWDAAMADGVRQLLMVNALPFVGNNIHWDPPLWSLSTEAFCYVVLFPPLFIASRWMKNRSLILLAGLTAAIVTFAYIMVAATRGAAFNQLNLKDLPGFNEETFRAVFMFTAGWLAFLISSNYPAARRWLEKSTDYIMAGMIIILLGQATRVLDGRLLIILMPWLIVGLQSGDSRTARFLSLPKVHFLGIISYSIYLIHWPIMDLTTYIFPDLSRKILFRLPFELTVLIILSALCYRFFEAPARRFIRSKLGVKKPIRVDASDFSSDLTQEQASPALRS
jgi:peptidoglycan/LPS O-acetylase OafA/YrhL